MNSSLRLAARCLAIGAASWLTYAGIAWLRYGHPKPPTPAEKNPLLDHFMPTYDVVDRHYLHVAAPVDTTFAAALALNLEQSRAIRAIFKTRELILGTETEKHPTPAMFLEWAKALGWGVLAEIKGREIVMGAVTKPWEPNVVFRAIPPDDFAAFREPGYVKIAWTLRADPLAAHQSMARTETRVTCTDGSARAKFRRYWAFLSPGIVLIRRIALRMVKQEAERRRAAAKENLSPPPAALPLPDTFLK